MTTVKTVDFKQQTTTSSNVKQRRIKEDDNIFASYARKAGMENFADFLRDDWTANMARKAGNDKFADWLENKPDEDGKKSNYKALSKPDDLYIFAAYKTCEGKIFIITARKSEKPGDNATTVMFANEY